MKKLLNYDFEYVLDINPIMDKLGVVKEFFPQEKYINKNSVKLNKYGSGAFCRFSIHPKWSGVYGVYALYIDDILVYIGQAIDFAKRFNMGYGNISPKNCYIGGQSTNCKINKLILNSVKEGKIVSLYFHMTPQYNKIEFELIKFYKPKYNDSLNSENVGERLKKKLPEVMPSKNLETISELKQSKNPGVFEVRKFIQNQISIAKEQGKNCIEICSGDIHKKLNMKNAMPTVCSAMRTLDGEYQGLFSDIKSTKQ